LDSDLSEDENNTNTNRFCCCSPPPGQETIDEDGDSQGGRVMAQAQDGGAPNQPSEQTMASQTEEWEIKVLEDSDCEKVHEEVKNESDSGGEKICRYCFDGDGELIAPCKCIGSQKWVHKECLIKWQRMCQVRKSTHPWYRDQSDPEKVCYVCVSAFDIKPPNYEELVQGLTGDEIVARIKEGFLIVATKESSEQSRAILRTSGHIEHVYRNLTPWIGGVYLIIEITTQLRDDVITAVNLAQEIPRPPSSFNTHIREYVRSKKVQVKWMDSGPCEGLHGIGCLRATSREDIENVHSLNVMDDMPHGLTIAGNFRTVVNYCHDDWCRENRQREQDCINCSPMPAPPNRLVYACRGDGTWTRSQLIGEIARGAWGMARYKTNDVFKVPNQPHPPAPSEIYDKLHDERRPIAPGENEMSRAFDEALDPRPFQDTAEARKHREKLRAQLLANCRRSQSSIPQAAPTENEESKIMDDSQPVDISMENTEQDMDEDQTSQQTEIETEDTPTEVALRTRGVDL